MMGSRDGEWGGLEVLMVNSSNTPSSALRAWVVQLRISNRGSLVEFKVVQGFCQVSFRQRR